MQLVGSIKCSSPIHQQVKESYTQALQSNEETRFFRKVFQTDED